VAMAAIENTGLLRSVRTAYAKSRTDTGFPPS